MNHRCDDFLEKLGAYLDGELDKRSERDVEQHLESCPSCRAALDEMRLGDRLLRAHLAGEEISAERAERSLSNTLERIRREPRDSWEPRESKKPQRGSLWWNWRLRWAAGIAVATAAVLLALRLGPLPVAPEKPKGVPHVPAREMIEKKGPSTALEQPIALDQSTTVDRPTTADQPTTAEQPTKDETEPARMKDRALESAPTAAAQPTAKGTAAEQDVEEADLLLVETGSETGKAEAKQEGTQEGTPAEPIKLEPRIRGGRTELPPTAMHRETATVTAEKKADLHESVSQRVAAADSRSDVPYVVARNGTVETWNQEIRKSDTLGSTTGWTERLETEERSLRATPEEELDRAERARRWRRIGDLWEWMGRRDDSPAAFARALEAYRMAIAASPAAADLDSIRVQRARTRSADAIEGNIPPAER